MYLSTFDYTAYSLSLYFKFYFSVYQCVCMCIYIKKITSYSTTPVVISPHVFLVWDVVDLASLRVIRLKKEKFIEIPV